MATRMQQRRGTAAQWISTNSGNGPILAAGEVGFESDTNKFKIGDGVNHWVDLTYFTDADSIVAAVSGIVDGAPGLLDTLNELAAALGDDPDFLTNYATIQYVTDALGNAEVDQSTLAGTGIDWNAGTSQFDIDSTVATLAGTQTLTNKTLTSPKINEDVALTATATELNILDGATLSTTELNYVDGVTSAIQTQLDAKASSSDLTSHATDTTSIHGISDTAQLAYKNAANQTFTGNMEIDGNLVVDGDFTVNGTNFSASATSIVIEDNMIQLAHQNAANTVDLGIVVAYNDGAAKHSGIVRDVSANTWKLFKGVTTEPSTTVDFTQGSLDDLAVAGLTASTLTVTSGTVDFTGSTITGIPTPSSATPTTAGIVFGLTTNATKNAVLGYDALSGGSKGTENVALGYQAFKANSGNGYTVAIGSMALSETSAAQKNTAVGAYALSTNASGDSNTAVGYGAGWGSSGANGSNNVMVGKDTMYSMSTASYNTVVGTGAAGNLTTGSYNVVLGTDAQPSSATVSYEMTLGSADITRLRIPGLNLDTNTATDGQVLGWNDTTNKFQWITPAQGAAFSEFMLIGA